MAQGDILLNADGTVALNGAGLVRLVDVDSDCPDCCGAGCTAVSPVDECTHCDDVTPSQYQVTISSVTVCGCYTGDAIPSLNFTINGAHTLTQLAPGSCFWFLTITNGLTITSYSSSDGSCTGSTTTSSQNVTMILSRLAGEWDFTITTPDYLIFNDTQDADTSGASELCATISNTFTNDWVVGDCGTIPAGLAETVVTYGGSATVVCL